MSVNLLNFLGEFNTMDLIQTGEIVITLIILTLELRNSIKINKLTVSFQITSSHHEIWSHLLTDSKLARVLEVNVDLENEQISPKEKFFIILVVSHLNSVYDAQKERLIKLPKNFMKEISYFFTLPIPKMVWQDIKQFHPKEFVDFVEQHIR